MNLLQHPVQPVPPDPLFEIGPHKAGDLRQHRPYFLIPLGRRESHTNQGQGQRGPDVLAAQRKGLSREIADFVAKSAKQPQTLLLRVDYTPLPGEGIFPGTCDLLQPDIFVQRIRQAANNPTANNQDGNNQAGDPQAHYLRRLLTPDTLRLLDTAPASTPPEVVVRLVQDLNDLIQSPCLYHPDFFSGITLTPEVQYKVQQAELEGWELMELNRVLLEAAFPGEFLHYLDPTNLRGEVTDIYVLSHGWHRNFFGAVAAYDRLVSRFSVLAHRRRLRHSGHYNPLFLTLHWHSDPGENGWLDREGRRSKESFLRNVEAVFERPSSRMEAYRRPGERFQDVFEDIYQFCSRVSAPDSNVLQDSELEVESHDLSVRLNRYLLRDASDATSAEKVAAVWRCYQEAESRAVLLDQDSPPARFHGFLDALTLLFKFVIAGGLGAMVLARFLKPDLLASAFQSVRNAGPLAKFTNLELFAVAFVTALFVLKTTALWQQSRHNKAGAGTPFLALLAWAVVQIPLALPVVFLSVGAFFMGWVFDRLSQNGQRRIWGLYPERLGAPNQDPLKSYKRRRSHINLKYWGFFWGTVARLPVRWLRQAVAPDSKVCTLVEALDSQLAFWEMQRRGTQMGGAAAFFLRSLYKRPEFVEWAGNARLHFIGHSFGGLVVANAARHMVLDGSSAPSVANTRVQNAAPLRHGPERLHSVCLIQGALASSWFEHEPQLVESIDGALVCIYSRYDTANGFYYPLANFARCAAGYLGLTKTGGHKPIQLPDTSQNHRAVFASLVQPPPLAHWLPVRTPNAPYVLNLDASRFVHSGPVLMGGGHGDIYKDDMIYLVWAVTRL